MVGSMPASAVCMCILDSCRVGTCFGTVCVFILFLFLNLVVIVVCALFAPQSMLLILGEVAIQLCGCSLGALLLFPSAWLA